MLRGWKVPLLGILIVGLAAFITPLMGWSEYVKTVPLFILFVLFVLGMQVLEFMKNKAGKRKR